MRYAINSRKLNREVVFSRPGSHYIRVNLNGQPGTLGLQPCAGGSFSGSTLVYSGDNESRFEAICRRWWKAYLRNNA